MLCSTAVEEHGPAHLARIERSSSNDPGIMKSEAVASSAAGSRMQTPTLDVLHVCLAPRTEIMYIWLDRSFGRRYGETPDSSSITNGAISFSLFVHAYEGTLINGGRRIEGTWNNALQAPYRYTQSSESACASFQSTVWLRVAHFWRLRQRRSRRLYVSPEYGCREGRWNGKPG